MGRKKTNLLTYTIEYLEDESSVYTKKGKYVEGPKGWYMDFRKKQESDVAIVAWDDKSDSLVGVLKCYWAGSVRGEVLCSLGTWVVPRFRKLGVGKKMWQIAIKKLKPQIVWITALTDKGKTLVESLKVSIPKVTWLLDEAGNRPLRVL